MTWMVWALAAICLFAEDPSRESVFQTASAALAAGDYPAAERGFKALLSKSPSDIASLGNLGVLYSRTGRSTEAISTYRQALRIHPDDPGILLNLGLVYFKQENFAGALPYFEQLIATNPANSQAVLLLAACRVYTGNPQPAISLLEPLSTATPADQGALYLLAVAYQKNKQPIKAKQTLTQMLQSAIPDLKMTGKQRTPVAGEVPNPLNPPTGCAFHPRCPHANERCKHERPEMIDHPEGGQVACHAVEERRIDIKLAA